jgi:hypothetical protein
MKWKKRMVKLHRVRVGTTYRFHPAGMDRWSPVHQGLKDGDLVTVVNLHGAPKANTMGHCYVNKQDGTFGGMVLTNSLVAVGGKK